MRAGVSIPQTAQLSDPSELAAFARAAETAGFACLWAHDRLLTPVAGPGAVPASPDPLVVLTMAAAATSGIRLGTGVLAGPWYPPTVLARSLATLDVMSGGRLSVGIGLGHSAADFESAGVPRRHLAARADELLDVLEAVWGSDPVSYTGARVRIPASAVQPKPTQQPRPPVLLAARTPAGLGRAARRADGWVPWGLPVHALAPMWRVVRDLATCHGRSADELQLVVHADLHVTGRSLGSDRRSYAGSLDQVAADLVETAAAGAHEVVLSCDGAATGAELLDMSAAVLAEAGLGLAAAVVSR